MLARGLGVAVIGPLLAIGLHELTHLGVARLWGPVSIEVTSRVPVRIRLTFATPPPRWYQRVVVIAPILVGLATGLVVLGSGTWAVLTRVEPHYFDTFLLLDWIVYMLPSRADLRAFVEPQPDHTLTE